MAEQWSHSSERDREEKWRELMRRYFRRRNEQLGQSPHTQRASLQRLTHFDTSFTPPSPRKGWTSDNLSNYFKRRAEQLNESTKEGPKSQSKPIGFRSNTIASNVVPEMSVRPKVRTPAKTVEQKPFDSIESVRKEKEKETNVGYNVGLRPTMSGRNPYKDVKQMDFVRHKVGSEYRKSIRQRSVAPHAPFGYHSGFPIEGPPNWSQIWTDWSAIGDDFNIDIPSGLPLNRLHLSSLQMTDEELKNIRFISLLGTGAYGQVWAVEVTKTDKSTNRTEQLDMACKVMRLKYSVKYTLKQTVNSMLADVKILQYLNHNNIVNYIDMIGIPDRKTYFPYSVLLLLMERCDGDLDKIMAATLKYQSGLILPEKYCKIWVKQIGEGVKYLHSQNVVHMDIKPPNILYKYNNIGMCGKKLELKDINEITFKLGDFGLSIAYIPGEPCVVTDRRPGTRKYWGPEMNNFGLAQVQTKPNDIHCLGITLAEVILGYDVFNNNDTNTLMARIVSRIESNLKYGISAEAADLIYSMTRVTPKDRITIEKLVDHDWFKTDTGPQIETRARVRSM